MDPKKSSTVTSPDLLTAFNEGRGVDDTPEDSGKLRIWLVLFTEPDGADRALEFSLTQWDTVFGVVQAHMQQGDGRGAALLVSETQPELFSDALLDISQIAT